MNFSFDWDCCLEASQILKNLFSELHFSGVHHVYIVTSRAPDDTRNADLRAFVSEFCHLSFGHLVHFTDDKLKTIQDLEINLHFDDDKLTVAQVNEWKAGTAVLVNYQMEDFLFRP